LIDTWKAKPKEMFLRIIPILLIGIPILGFFFEPEPPKADNSLASLVFILFSLPWYFKVLSIVIGIVWVASWGTSDEEQES